MTYDGNHFRISAIGTHYEEEMWTWSLSYGAPGGWIGPQDAITPQILADVAAAVSTFHSNVTNAQAKLREVKIALIGPDGKYATNDLTPLHTYPTPVAGVNTNAAALPQVALAVTLRTDRRRGAGASGRFYVPFPAYGSLGTNGLIDSGIAASIADRAVTMLNAITAAMPTDAAPIVASQGGVGVGPANVPVTHVEVGRVLDTQRRRRNKQVEAHVKATTALTAPA